MKEFLSDFFELLSSCVLVICLALASFLLIINIYHYKEIRYTQSTDITENGDYINYKKTLKTVDKKMKSVNVDNVKYDSTAKTIYSYYEGCMKSLKTGTFSTFEGKGYISALDIYKANDEILKKYNKVCVFGIPYNITVISKNFNLSSSDTLFKKTEEKRQIIIDNADYLTKSGLGNSAYAFSTDATRGGIYNKISNETKLTVNNYRVIASILNDVANWYVSEFGGNR